jgi:hypothetical protein
MVGTMSPASKTSKRSLLSTFETLDRGKKLLLAKLARPLDVCLIALKIAKDGASYSELTAEHIEACLEIAGVAISKASIRSCLSRAGNRVKTHTVGPDRYYKLMTPGELAAEAALQEGSVDVVYIQGGTPRTARKTLEMTLAGLKGETIVCDPYIGSKSLDSLEFLKGATTVRFLTMHLPTAEKDFAHRLADFKKQFGNFEFRQVNGTHRIHDRFLMDGDSLYFIGHGLKDIGNAQSFMIRLDTSLVSDVCSQLKQNYMQQWGLAKPI